MKIMLNYQLDPHHQILNNYPPDLKLINKNINNNIKLYFYQKCKINNKVYGHLHPKNIQHLCPWDELHVDMVGPWKVIIDNFEYQSRAATCIDVLFNLPEVIPVKNTKLKTVAEVFKDNWLSRDHRLRTV